MVYATTAVKERVLTEPMGAKVRVEVDERTDWLELKFDMEGFGKPKSGKSSNRLKKTQISPVAKRSAPAGERRVPGHGCLNEPGRALVIRRGGQTV